MRRLSRVLKIGGVAGKAIFRRVRKLRRGVALGTILDFMPLRQREKIVVNFVRLPTRSIRVVAFQTIGRKARVGVVRVCRDLKIFQMAVDTIRSDSVKPKVRFRVVAVGASRRPVQPDERKTILQVDFEYVVNEPVLGRVAAGAVVAEGRLVGVGVAGGAFFVRFFKNQSFVAGAAVEVFVFASEREFCPFVVVKNQGVEAERHPCRAGDSRVERVVFLPKIF